MCISEQGYLGLGCLFTWLYSRNSSTILSVTSYKANANTLDTRINGSYGVSYLPHVCVTLHIIKPSDQNRC